ncbi:MAG: hypothetical protein Q4F88_05180 [Eubacteriales bacterium]|nr:hypothetical protein [Eubacteriales bacterium]
MHYKLNISLYLAVIILLIRSHTLYAGTVEKVDGFEMYKLSNNEYAKDTWCYVDFNGDSIKECYRFDSLGHIVINFISEDGRATNEKGQLIENGFVVEKMLNGRIRYGDGTPDVFIEENNKNLFDSPTDNKKHPSENNENKGVIKTVEIDDDFIGPIAPLISNQVIYAGDTGVTSIGISKNNGKEKNIVAGKKIENYVDTKVNCKIDVDNVVIYGGAVWDDCIELHGSGAKVSFNLKNNNYMYFEVAEEAHVEDEKEISLEVYVDGILYETLDEFVEDNPQEFSEKLFDSKKVELKVKSKRSTSRRIYIHNGRFKKIKEDDE